MRLSILLGLLAVVLCAWFASAAPNQESEQRQISKEQQQMIDAAGKAYEAAIAMYDVGAGGITSEAIYTWSRRWADAEASGAPRAEQVKVFMAHCDRMKKLLEKVSLKFQNGFNGGEKDKVEAARYYATEADYLLLKTAPDSE
jgi:hypothetical protein